MDGLPLMLSTQESGKMLEITSNNSLTKMLKIPNKY